ncbi:hypothetical protein CH330_01910 [candidate division WOR-3 bacterium JGI_Cruoil_03_51_56]|uniref:DUF6922 domain-containing protein n=1 Tax=candidate division WOR-3 bacterium JGI_Cruoil_03_51_56 TaxID=1973747 RepID=A0A235BY71_UNCW3|nr:MAG: hypothetical protein CH330_01910 [candidate division WOR-3 bacterium JGI_Cruoil_03_51_56]
MNQVIPESVRRLFWDIRVETVDVKYHYRFIIRRVLDFGNPAAIKWLRATYPSQVIKEVVDAKRGLAHKTVVFWTRYFKIDAQKQHV